MTGPIFVSPPVNASSQGIEDTRTAIAVKTSLEDVFAFFYCLSRFFQLALIFCQRLANSSKRVRMGGPLVGCRLKLSNFVGSRLSENLS